MATWKKVLTEGAVNASDFTDSDGTSGQVLQTNGSDTLSWGNKTTNTNTNQLTTFTVSASTDTTATTISQGDVLMFTAGTGITCETTADGTVTITNTVSDTNTMGSGFTVSATTDSNATTITQGDDLMFTAGTGITCETTADGTVTISNAGGRRNIIINGGMQINQRLAVGSTVTTAGIKSTDRWSVLVTGATHTQGVVANSVADTLTTGASNALKQINTGTSSATSAYAYSQYIIEAQDIRNCGWDYTSASSYVTLSFWVKSSLAGTFYCVAYTNDGTSQQYPHPFTLSADTWTNVSFSIPGNANLTFDNDNGVGMPFIFCAHLGTDYTSSSATDNAWVAYDMSAITDDYPQNWCNTASATWEITAVQLEVGSTATDFEYRSYGEELALCRRYLSAFRKDGGGNTAIGMGIISGTTTISLIHLTLPVEMRAPPTLTVTTPTSSTISEGAADRAVTSQSIGSATKNNCLLSVTHATGTAAGTPVRYSLTDTILLFSAEL